MSDSLPVRKVAQRRDVSAEHLGRQGEDGLVELDGAAICASQLVMYAEPGAPLAAHLCTAPPGHRGMHTDGLSSWARA